MPPVSELTAFLYLGLLEGSQRLHTKGIFGGKINLFQDRMGSGQGVVRRLF